MKVISPLDGGGQEVILTLIQGGCNFILRPTLLILEPPLHITIAQSLSQIVSPPVVLSWLVLFDLVISRLHGAGTCWLRFSGVFSKLVNQLSKVRE